MGFHKRVVAASPGRAVWVAVCHPTIYNSEKYDQHFKLTKTRLEWGSVECEQCKLLREFGTGKGTLVRTILQELITKMHDYDEGNDEPQNT